MNPKTNGTGKSANLNGHAPLTSSWLTPPATHEERLARIDVMGKRISGHIRFMCEVGVLNGSSTEAKEKAINAFYERMVQIERQLGRIQDELLLS